MDEISSILRAFFFQYELATKGFSTTLTFCMKDDSLYVILPKDLQFHMTDRFLMVCVNDSVFVLHIAVCIASTSKLMYRIFTINFKIHPGTGQKIFLISKTFHTGSGVYPASYSMTTGVLSRV